MAAALVQSQGQIDRAAIHNDDFRFAKLTDVYDARFLPGASEIRRHVPGLLSLAASTRLWLAGEPVTEDCIIRACWRASGNPERLTTYSGGNIQRDAVEWLLR